MPTDPAKRYSQARPAASLARLNQLAELVEAGRTAFHAQGEAFGWKPQIESCGRDEAEAAAAGNELANMASHAPAVASIMLRTASEQLAGLGSILRSGEVFGAVEPVVRSVLENAAMAVWVLDPQVTGEERGARVIALELATATRQRSAIVEVTGSESGSAFNALSESIDQLTRLAEVLYPPFAPPSRPGGAFTVGGETYPGFSKAVRLWADGAGGGRVSGKGVYGLLCGSTHPQGFAARLTWQPGASNVSAKQVVDLVELEAVVTAAVSPFYSGLVLLASYNGWLPNSGLNSFEELYERTVPGALGAPSS